MLARQKKHHLFVFSSHFVRGKFSMLVWDLKITLYICIAISTLVVAIPHVLKQKLIRDALLFWVCMLPFLTLIGIPIVTFAATIILFFQIRKNASPPEIIFLFITLLGAVPVWFEYDLQLGGTLLYTFPHWKTAVIILLIPLIPTLLKQKKKFDIVDIIFCIFVVFVCLHYVFFDQRGTLLVNIRLAMDVVLFHGVTYFVISRTLLNYPRETVIAICCAFVAIGLILSGVFVMNQVGSVDLYRHHSTAGNIYNLGFIREYRGPFLRTEGPFVGEAMGFILGCSAGALFFLRGMLNVSHFKFFSVLGLFLLACLITGSRGVLFTYLLILSSFVFLMSSAAFKIITIFVAAFAAVMIWIITNGVLVNDEYGTFDFRAQLFETSFAFIADHPFGHSLYVQFSEFDHLRRGPTQFLDVVSVYLQYLLPMGYLGLLLYVVPFVVTVFQLFSFSTLNPNKAGMYADVMKLFLASVVGYLFMIGSVSDGGLIGMFGLIFLAVGRGLILGVKNQQAISAK